MRHPLTRALASAGLNAVDVATRLQVDPKTVDRWFNGRIPYPRYRNELSRMTGWAVADLWPDSVPREPHMASDEVRMTYAHRSLVPPDTWHSLFDRATEGIDIVVYSALFLLEDPIILRTLTAKAKAGVPIRIAMGDTNSPQVAARGNEEQIGDLMAARIRNAMVLIKPLQRLPQVEMRLHNTVLYDSIYRADNEALVNIHIHGVPAAHAPVIHVQFRQPDGLTASYMTAIERVWSVATSYAG
jgi:hypothetical protein